MTYQGQPFDTPEAALEHFGVKGMRWGVRKAETPSGEIVLSKDLDGGGKLVVRKKTYDDTSRLYRLLYSKKTFEKDRITSPQFLLTNKAGQKVGEAGFYRSSQNTLELEWVGVDKAHRRQGYARGAMEGVIAYAKSEGITELNLTATDMGAPLYESLGFKKVSGGYHQMKIPAVVTHSSAIGGFSDRQLESLADHIATALKGVEDEPEELVHAAPTFVQAELAKIGNQLIKICFDEN